MTSNRAWISVRHLEAWPYQSALPGVQPRMAQHEHLWFVDIHGAWSYAFLDERSWEVEQEGRSYGYPWRTLSFWTMPKFTPDRFKYDPADVRWAWIIDSSASAGKLGLPLCPVWPGFMLDSVMLGGAAWGIWQGREAIRRWVRRRRDQCPRCGYDLVGLPDGAPCPECGSAPSAPQV